MRFQQLQIPAFGPFTNFGLQFTDQPGDLHLIYGANEAGKSSLLRAIRDLLFGIHGQSPDNFLHDYAALRIKGEIRNRNGAQLVVQRRKGNKNTLLDAQGAQLPDRVLAQFLGNVDQSYFSAMFGLGARELHEGAQALLRGEGNLGNALFSASLGGTPVQKIVESLQQEAARLFNGRATKDVTIRPASNRYKDLLRQSRDAIVNPETWDKLENDLNQAEAETKSLNEGISNLDRDLQWIGRCEDALPTVGRLNEEMQKLGQIPVLPDLASDFVSRAQTARGVLNASRAETQRLSGQLGKLQTQLQSCATAPAVLVMSSVLDQLHQDLGVYHERKNSLTDDQAKLSGLEPLIRAGMQRLQLKGEFDTLERHRLSSPARLACEEAASVLIKASTKLSDSSDSAETLQHQIQGKESQLTALPKVDLTAIRDALSVAAEATEADRTLSTSEAEVERLTREVTDQHRQLAGIPADFDATARLPVPAPTTIRNYHERLEGIKRELKSEQEKVFQSNGRADAIQAELARLQRRGELPSEEALRHAREQRDRGWTLVLAEWKGGGTQDVLVPGSPLETAFPMAIAHADQIADQLRFDAEAVAQAEEKRSQLRVIANQALTAQDRTTELQVALNACEQVWQAEWSTCGINPRSPLEMEEWREQWSEFRNRLASLRTGEETLQRKRGQIQTAKQRLALVLGRDDTTEFRILFNAARELVQKGEKDSGRHEAMADQLQSLKDDLAKLEKSRARLEETVRTASENWKAQCTVVGLPPGTSPEAGAKLLQERQDLFAKIDSWQELSRESRTKAQSIAQYEKAVSEQATALGVPGATTEAQESALWKALTSARKAQDDHDRLSKQIEETGVELTKAEAQVTQSQQILDDLLTLAGLAAASELEPLLAHLEKRTAVQQQIDDLRKTLSGLARGQAVDDFVAKVRAENPEELAQRKATATREKAEKESALPPLRETLFQLGAKKRDLEKAGDAAADFRQQAESCAATLRMDAARFLRLRLATHFLENQIERFRKENQGPLLKKSGEVFQAITRGAFSGLSADFNADDLPVLVAVRSDDTKVPVEGLSDGSRDQLYLALRLAALDRYLDEHEPMPLILDDLLITFDDDRTKAILPQLGALAQRTQVFLFTHHEHLIELCCEALGKDRFHLHRLGSAA